MAKRSNARGPGGGKAASRESASGKADSSGTGDPAARLRRRARQFLVHSFLYYRLGESALGDDAFDRIAEELRRLRAQHADAELPYAELLAPALGPEGSGFLIRAYPPEIVSAAFKLLYATSAPDVEFREFVEQRGYTLEGPAVEEHARREE